ncbi:MAG: hypothetical protein IIA88_05180, partial [Bacteroidetes bacterium]|nr:hypothetical protein [Bacteroidota bacterium]
LSKVKLASIFASQINEVKLIINTKKSVLEIHSENTKKGNFTSSLHAEINGEGFEVVFNYKYLLDGLANIKEENVFFELNNASSPAILKSKNSNYLYITGNCCRFSEFNKYNM